MDRHRFNLTVLAFLISAALVSFVSVRFNNNTVEIPVVSQVMAEDDEPTPSAISSDGKYSIGISSSHFGNEYLWDFYINGDLVNTETLPQEMLVSLPFNSFSPDNKYYFYSVQSGLDKQYWYGRVDGVGVTEEGITAEITGNFHAQHKDLEISEITGWASPILLIINTVEPSGRAGPSFWFNIKTKSFTRLISRFN